MLQTPSRIRQASDKSTQLRGQLSKLTDTSGKQLTPFEEKVFRCILKKKEACSTDDLIRVKNTHGRPRTLVSVRVPEVASTEACSRTVRERSKFQEKLMNVTVSVTGQSQQERDDNINLQRTSLIGRAKQSYAKSAKDAGVKILAKFSPQAAGLKKEMSLDTWRLVKRALENVTGADILGTEGDLRKEMEKSNFQYECGTFKAVEKD